MSDTQHDSGDKIRYRIEKYSRDLETLTLEEHVTISNILQQMVQFRVASEQRKAKEDAEKVQAEANRQAKFGLVPQA